MGTRITEPPHVGSYIRIEFQNTFQGFCGAIGRRRWWLRLITKTDDKMVIAMKSSFVFYIRTEHQSNQHAISVAVPDRAFPDARGWLIVNPQNYALIPN